MLGPHGFDEAAQDAVLLGEGAFDGEIRLGFAGKTVGGVDDNRAGGGAPDFDVGAFIASISETLRVGLRQRIGLALRFEIGFAVRGEDAIEAAEMLGDGFGRVSIRRRGQDQCAPRRTLFAQPRQQTFVIR